MGSLLILVVSILCSSGAEAGTLFTYRAGDGSGIVSNRQLDDEELRKHGAVFEEARHTPEEPPRGDAGSSAGYPGADLGAWPPGSQVLFVTDRGASRGASPGYSGAGGGGPAGSQVLSSSIGRFNEPVTITHSTMNQPVTIDHVTVNPVRVEPVRVRQVSVPRVTTRPVTVPTVTVPAVTTRPVTSHPVTIPRVNVVR